MKGCSNFEFEYARNLRDAHNKTKSTQEISLLNLYIQTYKHVITIQTHKQLVTKIDPHYHTNRGLLHSRPLLRLEASWQ